MFDVTSIEEPVIRRAMEPFPKIAELVPFSTPVVSFGNPQLAEMVTIGINPSSLEFLEGSKAKRLLSAEKKRLMDLEELGLNNPQALNRDQALKVIASCYGYFEKNPYSWFDHLETHANNHFGYSYKKRNRELHATAAHLDLVQWATDPVWGGIKDKLTRQNLLNSDVDFLRYQLNTRKYKVVFLNGDQVRTHLSENGLVDISDEQIIKFKTKKGSPTSIKVYKGKALNSSNVFGWSRPFPGHRINAEEFPFVISEIHSYFTF